MRVINEIILHCSATPSTMDIGAKEIKQWHVDGNKWSDIGYHYIIKRDGKVETGRSIAKIGSHCKGRNKNSIGICLVGGVENNKPFDNFTKEQFESLKELLIDLTIIHCLTIENDVKGHNFYSQKSCPSFDWKTFIKNI
jgi:N-acetylmuramoyl-L-alanine amidase